MASTSQAEDPTKELSRLISERKYEEAFTGALLKSDVSIVSWLCSQVWLQLVGKVLIKQLIKWHKTCKSRARGA